MIVESLIAGVSLVLISSLVLADRIHKRVLEDERYDPDKRKASIAEQRRILQSQRDAYWNSFNKLDSQLERTTMWSAIRSLDEQLIKLAKEEGESW